MRHVVACAYNFPLSSSMRPSAVATVLPSDSIAPSARTTPDPELSAGHRLVDALIESLPFSTGRSVL